MNNSCAIEKKLIEFNSECTAYLICKKDSICSSSFIANLEQGLGDDVLPYLLIDLQRTELVLNVHEVPVFINQLCEVVLKHITKRIAFVCSGTFETAFCVLLGKRMFVEGIKCQVFCELKNAITWLKL